MSANRCPLRSKTLSLFLAVARELFFQRRQFCKWRIGIDRTVALARRRAGRPLTVRGATVALVAAALVASAEITAAALALVAATTLVAVALVAIELVAAVAVAALALDALTGRTVLTHLGRRRALSRGRSSHSLRRRTLAGLAKLVVAATAAMALLARRALGAFAAGCCCRAFGRAAVMALAVAVVVRAALLGTAAGPPDFDQYRLGRRIGLGVRGGRFGRSGFSGGGLAGRGGLCGSFRRACRFTPVPTGASAAGASAAGSAAASTGAVSTAAAGSSATGVTLGSNEADDTGALATGTSAATSSAGVSAVVSAIVSALASTGGASVETVSTTTSGAGFGGNGGRLSMR